MILFSLRNGGHSSSKSTSRLKVAARWQRRRRALLAMPRNQEHLFTGGQTPRTAAGLTRARPRSFPEIGRPSIMRKLIPSRRETRAQVTPFETLSSGLASCQVNQLALLTVPETANRLVVKQQNPERIGQELASGCGTSQHNNDDTKLSPYPNANPGDGRLSPVFETWTPNDFASEETGSQSHSGCGESIISHRPAIEAASSTVLTLSTLVGFHAPVESPVACGQQATSTHHYNDDFNNKNNNTSFSSTSFKDIPADSTSSFGTHNAIESTNQKPFFLLRSTDGVKSENNF